MVIGESKWTCFTGVRAQTYMNTHTHTWTHMRAHYSILIDIFKSWDIVSLVFHIIGVPVLCTKMVKSIESFLSQSHCARIAMIATQVVIMIIVSKHPLRSVLITIRFIVIRILNKSENIIIDQRLLRKRYACTICTVL